jgi:DnaJ-class molecular chaperone
MTDVSQAERAAVAAFIDKAHASIGEVDSYYLLGVGRDASSSEIRSAYYRLAARLHPDLHGDWLTAELRRKLTSVFSRVVEAYKVLSNGERREQYDRGLAEGRVRWDADAAAKKPRIRRVEDEVPDGAARKFFVLGRDALLSGNIKSAVMNLELAMSMAPGNATIAAELARAKASEHH